MDAFALPQPLLRHVYRLEAELEPPVDIGLTPLGHRRVVAYAGGRAEGDGFRATLLRGSGADWQVLRPDGSAVADIRYTLQTADGAYLYVQAAGIRHGAPEVLERLARGEEVAPTEYSFRTTVRIETSDSSLAWMNDGVFVAVGGRRTSGVAYDVYRVD
jgi:Protein of unknown function (DUF3237)